MSLLNCFRAQHDVINDKWTLPGVAGLKLSFSHFDGYSPQLDGSVRTAVVESSDTEKGGNIIVSIIVRASNPSCKAYLFPTYTIANPPQIRITFASIIKIITSPSQPVGFLCYHMPLHHAS